MRKGSGQIVALAVFLVGGLCTSAGGSEEQAKIAEASSKVDAYIEAGWVEAAVHPAAAADDAELVRRLYLDLVGRIPRPDEVRRFLDNAASGKTAGLVDDLLDSPEFASHWAQYWTTALLGRGRLPLYVDRDSFASWLASGIGAGESYDEIARQLITATGNPVDNGAVNFLLSFEMNPEDTAESVAANFLGMQLGCARCHNHPYESWTREEFYGFAASFAGIDRDRPTAADRRTRRDSRRRVEEKKKQAEQSTGMKKRELRQDMMESLSTVRKTLRLVDRNPAELELTEGEETKILRPKLLDGSVPRGNPREGLADWLVRAENPYFSAAAVNRIWGVLFGRGLVEPVDAFGVGNPPSHPELLAFLARDFASHGYDLRRLFRVLTGTRAYRLSSTYAVEPPVRKLFAVAPLRRMSPEQLFNSLLTLLDLERDGRSGEFQEKRDDFLRRFVFLFDTDAVGDADLAQGTIPQALAMLNGPLTRMGRGRGGSSRGGRGRDILRGPSLAVDELFLRALARNPSATERVDVERFVRGEKNRRQAYRDVVWALANTSEFLFIH